MFRDTQEDQLDPVIKTNIETLERATGKPRNVVLAAFQHCKRDLDLTLEYLMTSDDIPGSNLVSVEKDLARPAPPPPSESVSLNPSLMFTKKPKQADQLNIDDPKIIQDIQILELASGKPLKDVVAAYNHHERNLDLTLEYLMTPYDLKTSKIIMPDEDDVDLIASIIKSYMQCSGAR